MEGFKKAAILENAYEAQLLDSILTGRDIPHEMRSYYDTSFDGLFQAQKGWGHVSAPERFHEEVKDILSEIRKGIDPMEEME
ncbi:MAG: hypothetical protein JW932_09710 [Deltaproteobacteria bacterium]|nr:hypothetical protein [Deltaproteobacteria bacterium]